MHGNRDFLLGQVFARAAGLTLLADPTLLVFGGQRWLLSHGDALCLADHDYQEFRQQVRSPAWQQAFLAQPLAARQATARALRSQSEARKQSLTSYADLDQNATRAWLARNRARTLIHGHTHRPATHDLDDGLQRLVLSDWEPSAVAPRAEALRLCLDHRQPGGEVLTRRIPLSGSDAPG
jgi:UDP-2,3-diacylglucosamine hydrolase